MPFFDHFPLTHIFILGAIFLGLLGVVVRMFFLAFSKPIDPTKANGVPIESIDYTEGVVLYMRSDGKFYQRVGPAMQVLAVRLKNGTIHKLGNPIPINPNELVWVV